MYFEIERKISCEMPHSGITSWQICLLFVLHSENKLIIFLFDFLFIFVKICSEMLLISRYVRLVDFISFALVNLNYRELIISRKLWFNNMRVTWGTSGRHFMSTLKRLWRIWIHFLCNNSSDWVCLRFLIDLRVIYLGKSAWRQLIT
jgi:hypothetical protein